MEGEGVEHVTPDDHNGSCMLPPEQGRRGSEGVGGEAKGRV